MNRKIFVIDAFSLIYKAYYGVRPMNAPDGTPTNAVYGFFSMLLRLLSTQKPDGIFAAFDAGSDTFRRERFEAYKATRQAMPEDLSAQIPIIMEILSAANIPFLSCPGLEADDILGTISRMGDEEGDQTFLVTGDRDSYQLASEATQILYSKRGMSDMISVTPDWIRENYGLAPSQLIDVKALMGDASDNIPGIKGIGEKTALKLISDYGSLENVFAHVDDLKGKLKERVDSGEEIALLSYELATIRRDAPISLDFETAAKASFANEKVYGLLSSLGMRNLIRTIGYEPPANTQAMDAGKREPETPDFVQGLPESAAATSAYAFYLEDADGVYYLGAAGAGGLYCQQAAGLEEFKAFFEDGSIEKYGCNLKEAYKTLNEAGIHLSGAALDISIAAYDISSSEGRYSLPDLCERYLGRSLRAPEASSAQLSFLSEEPADAGAAMALAVEKAQAVYEIASILKMRLETDRMQKLYDEIEHPLIFTLARMEEIGFRVDAGALEALGADFAARSSALTAEILELAGKGEGFNVNSPKQLGVLLFDELHLPVVKKTKTGYSTDAEVLEKLADSHPIIPKILELRAISKLESTYITGMVKLISPKDGRIHTSFNQANTSTGRLSSSSPNLQNIPTRTDEGRVIRKAFLASAPGWVLVDADYSQIELRVLAHMSGDEAMIESFKSGIDIHTRTASEVFSVPLGEVTKEMRSAAKAVNFGIVYGISSFGLGRNLGIARNQASAYIDLYLDRFTGVREYMNSIVDVARGQGYVETLFGRRCYLPDIKSRNHNARSFAERVALNAPIQGTAADIMKIAMIAVESRIEKAGMQGRLILQVHDELIIDCPEEEREMAERILLEEMQGAAELKVPLVVEVGSAASWYDAK